MSARRTFILTEAVAMLPLVRRILADVRTARARQKSVARAQFHKQSSPGELRSLVGEARTLKARLRSFLAEAGALGVEISNGVRCEALFPFEHRWIGPESDGKVRAAFFAYSDSQDTIREWFFADWPGERYPPSASWWNQFRPGQRVDPRLKLLSPTLPVVQSPSGEPDTRFFEIP